MQNRCVECIQRSCHTFCFLNQCIDCRTVCRFQFFFSCVSQLFYFLSSKLGICFHFYKIISSNTVVVAYSISYFTIANISSRIRILLFSIFSCLVFIFCSIGRKFVGLYLTGNIVDRIIIIFRLLIGSILIKSSVLSWAAIDDRMLYLITRSAE